MEKLTQEELRFLYERDMKKERKIRCFKIKRYSIMVMCFIIGTLLIRLWI